MLETKFMCHFLVENLKLNFNFSVFIRNIKLIGFFIYYCIMNSLETLLLLKLILEKKDLYVFDMIF